MTKKVILVTNIPNPYRLPLFNAVHRLFSGSGFQLKVIFGSAGYKRRKFELDLSEAAFSYEVLDSVKFTAGHSEKTMVTYGGLMRKLLLEKPDKIIVSGFSMATLKIWLLSFFRKTQYIIWSGSVEFPGWYDSKMRRFFRKKFIARASGFIAYGSLAAKYFESLGAPKERTFIATNTVDVKFFAEETQRLRLAAKPSDLKRILYVGYLEPRKNTKNLIEVMAKLAGMRGDVVLDMVGDGSERQLLEKLVADKGLEKRIIFHGFKQKQELPEFFAAASCFVFQTGFDIWGLVLNEAMAAGLPCIAPANAGASHDLIAAGNGFVVDFSNHDVLIEKINGLLNNPAEAARMGARARDFILNNASLEASAKGFLNAVILPL